MAIEFQKGHSLLHRLDARTKTLIFAGITILAVLILDPFLMALLFSLLYYFGTQAVDRKLLNNNLRILVAIFSTFAVFQVIFFTPKEARFIFYLIPYFNYIPVTVEGLVRAVAIFFRFFSVVLAVHLMLYTTPPVDLALSITRREHASWLRAHLFPTLVVGSIFFIISLMEFQSTFASLPLTPLLQHLVMLLICLGLAFLVVSLANHGLPPEMGLALTLGFATVGILSKQAQKITDAQKARGYDIQPKNLGERMRVLAALLLPIFVATMERSQDISIAILSRGFDYNINKRTYRRQLIFQRADYLVIGAIVTLILFSLGLNYLGWGNFTEQALLKLFKL